MTLGETIVYVCAESAADIDLANGCERAADAERIREAWENVYQVAVTVERWR